jgi:hypothetical protein
MQMLQINRDFYNECEREQGKGRKYEHIQPFASRASQLARRLATVFAFFQGEQEISTKTMQGACDIIRHSLSEWLRYADIEPARESDAERLLNWLVRKCTDQSTTQVAYSIMQTSCPRPMQKNKQLFRNDHSAVRGHESYSYRADYQETISRIKSYFIKID